MVNTGLFVNWNKRKLLIHIVQDMLRTRYNTEATSGPRLPNNTCEIMLQALHPSGANFAGSKDLLEYYFNMIKESNTNVVADKDPEIIDLDTDDVSYTVLDDVNESITVIDLDASETTGDQLNECARQTTCRKEKFKDPDIVIIHPEKLVLNTTKSVATGHEEVVVVDTPDRCSSNSKTAGKKSVLTESNQQRQTRKYTIKEEGEVLDEIEIFDDDDVTILDDSFCTPKRNVLGQMSVSNSSVHFEDPKVTVVKDNSRIMHQSEAKTDNVCVNQLVKHEHKTLTKTSSDSEPSLSSCNSKSPSSSSPLKKTSKLAYKRPAHLVHPLTEGSRKAPKTDSLTNIYNPNAGLTEKRSGLRPIVIDGNNVAVSHGKGQFSLRGIEICINYFEKRGHRQIKAFVPHYRTNKNTFDALHKMERQGTVVITPSRKVDGRVLASYDDRYIVQYASEFGGVIVSTDNYRDLLQENPDWKETIENRLLMFTWIDDLLMFPQDPLGRRGPSLDEFLKFPD